MGFKEQLYAVSATPDIEWFQNQLLKSGISPELADANGIVLHPGHYEMPYFDADGEYTKVSTRRNNTDVKDKRYGRKAGAGHGVAPRCYWPRHPLMEHTHTEYLVRDARWPLWIVEGEKKAICLQDALLRNKIPGSVASVPGVTNYGAVVRETRRVYFKAGDIQRPVFVCYDWHHTNDMVMGAEANLHDEMQRRGAEVHHLRWPVSPSDEEQKVDDYLVGGGSIVDAIHHSMQYPINMPREDYRWLNERYAVYNGKIIKLDGFATLNKGEFMVDTGAMLEPGKRGEMVPVAEGWLKWPYRHTVLGRCVVLPAVTHAPAKVVDGKINLARGWPAQLLGESLEPGECEVLDRHLRRFCEDDEQHTWLRQHIAHMIRYPNVTTSNAIALADEGGTGKGLLMSILKVALGDLFALVGNELTTQFNGSLVGKLLAHYDEPPSDKWVGGVLDKASKRLVGNPEVAVRELYKEGYSVQNRIRLMVTTNLQAVYGIPENDRRWTYFCGYSKLTPEESEELAQLRDRPDCPKVIASWALGVDLEGYDPMQRGPTTRARRRAVAASRGPVEFWLEESDELANGSDIWQTARLYDLYRLQAGGKVMSSSAFGAEMTRILGEYSIKIVMHNGRTTRMRAIRNVDTWMNALGAEWSTECSRGKVE
jgi:hypothetical protein